MPEEGTARPGPPEIRILEGAVLAQVIEHRELALAELIAVMTEGWQRPTRAEAIERAVDGLLSVGLLRREGERLRPSAAALRLTEIDPML